MARVLSGIQPTGDIHLGNYLGAVRQWVDDQHTQDSFFCVVDLHAITVPRDPAELRAKTLETTLGLVAAGLDPEVCTLFVQSHVHQHPELSWILESVASMGELRRMTQFKEKAKEGEESARVALFTYPVLQAADILLYDADVVPVGKDQKQHLEIARDIAIKMNEAYGGGQELLKLPEAEIAEEVAVVPGLDGRKMSKSYGNAIEIFGDEKMTRKRIMSIVTDSTPLEAPKDPEGSNIIALYMMVAPPEEVRRMEEEHREGGVGYGDFKKRLFEAMWDYFAPMRARREEILARPGYVDEVLADGARRAREIAGPTMERVKRAVGLM